MAHRQVVPLPVTRHVDLWCAQLSNDVWSQPDRLAILSEEETRRANSFRFRKHRDRFEAVHVALRMILSRYLQCEPVEVSLETGAYGKPRISDVTTDIFFNISHSDATAVFAVSRGADVGVDIECTDSCHPDVVEIAESFLSTEEFATVLSAPAAERKKIFLRCWTRKEAVLKACGRGFSVPSARCSIDPSGDPNHHEVAVAGTVSRWAVVDVHPSEGVIGAVAVESDGRSNVRSTHVTVTVIRAETVVGSDVPAVISTLESRGSGRRISPPAPHPSYSQNLWVASR